MATRLKNILRFLAVPAGGTAILPHFLNIDDTSVVPDWAEPSTEGFSRPIVDATNVTVTNLGSEAASLDVFVEYWHSFERVFGPESQTALTPQPFTPAGGSGRTVVQLVVGKLAADVTIVTDAGVYSELFALAITKQQAGSHLIVRGGVAAMFDGGGALAGVAVARVKVQIDGVDAGAGEITWLPPSAAGDPFTVGCKTLGLDLGALAAGAHTVRFVWLLAGANGGETATCYAASVPEQQLAGLEIEEVTP